MAVPRKFTRVPRGPSASAEAYTVNEEDPSVVRRIVYLQCGERTAKQPRFYRTFDEWQEENKPTEEMGPLGPVILT